MYVKYLYTHTLPFVNICSVSHWRHNKWQTRTLWPLHTMTLVGWSLFDFGPKIKKTHSHDQKQMGLFLETIFTQCLLFELFSCKNFKKLSNFSMYFNKTCSSNGLKFMVMNHKGYNLKSFLKFFTKFALASKVVNLQQFFHFIKSVMTKKRNITKCQETFKVK